MNHSPSPLDIKTALESLAGITALLEALEAHNKEQSESVSIIEPQSPTARFNSAASTFHNASKELIAAIQNLRARAPLNQQLSNLLAAIERDAEQFQKNIEANTLSISSEIHAFGNVQPKTPDENYPGDEWKHQ